MSRESNFWAVFTALALAALLIFYAQDKGFFESEQADSSDGDSTSSVGNSTENQFSTADSPDPLSLECLDHSGLARHDHVTLKIFIDGSPYTIESAIGIQTDICNGNENNMHTIHTHDDTGRLHVELNEAGNISLGVFFDIWGFHFDETGIFDYRANSTHEMAMYVHASSEDASEENRVHSFDDYLIQNGEVIEVHYRPKIS
tara:strand:+ start:233 stop:838 length:606 start_codon:yes stop_codon:yes gene_type:complete